MSKDPINSLESFLKFKEEYSPGAGFGENLKQLQKISPKLSRPSSSASSVKKHELSEPISTNPRKVEEDISIPLIVEKWSECENLSEFSKMIEGCTKCRVLAERRKNVVFGSGNPNADIVVVGEAPGADEDEQGFPFVGRAGKLLTDILSAISLKRDEVYICNILKCRPPENRNPLPDEIFNCEPYLVKQLEIIKPRLILALGTFAAQTLLKTKEPLGKLRGTFHSYKHIKLLATYHPAALLRNPNWKRPTWEDVKLFRKEYDSILNSEK
jgi:DNA polymerase